MNFSNYVKGLGICCFLAFAATTASVSASVFHNHGIVDDTWLGKGVSSRHRLYKEKCIEGDLFEIPNTKTSIQSISNKDSRSSLEITSGNISGGVDFFGILGGSISISLHEEISENNQTISSSFWVKYIAKDITLVNRRYTDLGESLIGGQNDEIMNICGNEFISHVKIGAQLYLSANLHFRSREEYEKKVTTKKVKVLFKTRRKTKVEEFQDDMENAVFSIKVTGNGALTPRLKQILNENTVYCDASTIEACFNTLDIIVDYLFADNGYVVDLNDENMKAVKFTTSSYGSSGHMALDVSSDTSKNPDIELIEEKFFIRLKENTRQAELLKAFIAVEKNDNERESMEEKLADIQYNKALIDLAVSDCQTAQALNICENVVNDMLDRLRVVVM